MSNDIDFVIHYFLFLTPVSRGRKHDIVPYILTELPPVEDMSAVVHCPTPADVLHSDP